MRVGNGFVLASLVFAAFVGFGCFESGKMYGLYKQRPALVSNSCGHYDQMTGDFQIGAPAISLPPIAEPKPEIVITKPLGMMVPKHKPLVPTAAPGMILEAPNGND